MLISWSYPYVASVIVSYLVMMLDTLGVLSLIVILNQSFYSILYVLSIRFVGYIENHVTSKNCLTRRSSNVLVWYVDWTAHLTAFKMTVQGSSLLTSRSSSSNVRNILARTWCMRSSTELACGFLTVVGFASIHVVNQFLRRRSNEFQSTIVYDLCWLWVAIKPVCLLVLLLLWIPY